ncbi:DedA family protein [Flavisolibacter tropicus]|uniref:Alkaline phosphatase n=1 Tax=Flavisolibacter tropicus TaxID=1492898 RepID=A0A172U002_9BACT|nr:VTT domain-containing protein [Flavisolibacter tropicus]ANE52681.1 alkaline phosphatase [Flavisolibacter tropicus]
MHHFLDIVLLQGGFIHQFIEWIINNGGLYILLLVVFAETGLFVGFFLPGDALLFAAGIYLDQLAIEFFGFPFYFVLLLVIVASVLGNLVGYWFGRKTGPLLFERRETWLFRKKHLLRAKEFYDRYGKATIFLAKFLPIIRTFAPIIAGVVKMERSTFILYNVLGSLAWVCSMMLGGYYLEGWILSAFGFSLKDHIETITIGIILITTVPVLYKLLFSKKRTVPLDENDKNPIL